MISLPYDFDILCGNIFNEMLQQLCVENNFQYSKHLWPMADGFHYSLIQFENVLRVIWKSKHCEQLEQFVRPLRNLQEAFASVENSFASIFALLCDSTRSGPWSQSLRGGADKLSPKDQM